MLNKYHNNLPIFEEFKIIDPTREKYGYNTDHESNTILLERKTIQYVKELYGDNDPLDQGALYYLINEAVLKQNIRKEIRDILFDMENFFHPDIIRKPTQYDIKKFIEHIKNKTKPVFVDGNGNQLQKDEKNRHHIIPRSRKDEGFLIHERRNHYNNIGKQFHIRWHKVNKDDDSRKILITYLERNKSVLSEEVQERIGKITALPIGKFYRKEVLDSEYQQKIVRTKNTQEVFPIFI